MSCCKVAAFSGSWTPDELYDSLISGLLQFVEDIRKKIDAMYHMYLEDILYMFFSQKDPEAFEFGKSKLNWSIVE